MTIKDLPEDIKLIALQRQQEQGNKPNENIDLNYGKSQGNFTWSKTPEGQNIWSRVNNLNNFDSFYEFHKPKEFTFNFDLI